MRESAQSARELPADSGLRQRAAAAASGNTFATLPRLSGVLLPNLSVTLRSEEQEAAGKGGPGCLSIDKVSPSEV